MRQTKVVSPRKAQSGLPDQDGLTVLEASTPLFSKTPQSAVVLPFIPLARESKELTVLMFDMPTPRCPLCKDTGKVWYNGKPHQCICGGRA